MSCPYNEKANICSTIFTFNMLHQGLTFIPLLLLLCQHGLGLNVYQSIICEGNNAVIKCDKGVISVLSSNYGRISKTACPGSYGIGSAQVANDACFKDTTAKVSAICTGQQTCTFAVSNKVFTDPCRGIYKYLDVSYSCGPDVQEPFDCGPNGCKIFSICQFEKKEFNCSSDEKMTVKYASYGRRTSQICRHSNLTLTSSECFSDETSSVKLLCDEKPKCNIYVSSLVYLDLCPHVYKYLEVFYKCSR